MRYNYTDRALKEQFGEGGGSTSTNYNKIVYIEGLEDAYTKGIFNNENNLKWAKELIKEEYYEDCIAGKKAFWNYIKDEYYNSVIFCYQSLRETNSIYPVAMAIPCQNSTLLFSYPFPNDSKILIEGLQIRTWSPEGGFNLTTRELQCIETADAIIEISTTVETATSDIFKTVAISSSSSTDEFLKITLNVMYQDLYYSKNFYWYEGAPAPVSMTIKDNDTLQDVTYNITVNVTTQARLKQYTCTITKAS